MSLLWREPGAPEPERAGLVAAFSALAMLGCWCTLRCFRVREEVTAYELALLLAAVGGGWLGARLPALARRESPSAPIAVHLLLGGLAVATAAGVLVGPRSYISYGAPSPVQGGVQLFFGAVGVSLLPLPAVLRLGRLIVSDEADARDRGLVWLAAMFGVLGALAAACPSTLVWADGARMVAATTAVGAALVLLRVLWRDRARVEELRALQEERHPWLRKVDEPTAGDWPRIVGSLRADACVLRVAPSAYRSSCKTIVATLDREALERVRGRASMHRLASLAVLGALVVVAAGARVDTRERYESSSNCCCHL